MKKLASLVVMLALAGSFSACSSDEPDDETISSQPSVPSSTGDQCEDPVGDLTADAKTEGVGTEPAGVDITAASAEVQGEDLVVSFTTAGPIDQTPGTTFAVAQGTPFSALAFEMRATATDTGAWDVKLITWDAAERSTSVPVRPTVSGNTMTFTVPMRSLPALALYIQFGASAVLEGAGRVVDDCSSLSTASTVG